MKLKLFILSINIINLFSAITQTPKHDFFYDYEGRGLIESPKDLKILSEKEQGHINRTIADTLNTLENYLILNDTKKALKLFKSKRSKLLKAQDLLENSTSFTSKRQINTLLPIINSIIDKYAKN